MDALYLNISLSGNRVLNQDGITALRSLNLIQGDSYQVNLAFLNGSIPTITNLAFNLRNSAGVNLVSVSSFGTGSGGYPYNFALPLTSPVLNGNIGSLKAFLSYVTSGNSIEVIQPFDARLVPSPSGTPATGYVSTLNGLSASVVLSGSGIVSVATAGQTLTLSADTSSLASQASLIATGTALNASISALASQTGSFYPSSNPSGFVGSSSLSAYALNSSLTGASGILQGQISSLVANTGGYYPRTNPSGFLSSSALSPYALNSFVTGLSGVLQAEINAMGGGGSANTVNLTGNQLISGVKTFSTGIIAPSISGGNANFDFASATLSVVGQRAFDFNYRQLYDRFGRLSANYDSRYTVDENSLGGISWGNGLYQCFDTNANTVLDWQNKQLFDSAANTSIDWTSRVLYDSVVDPSIDWDQKQLKTNGSPSLDWSAMVLKDDSHALSVDWKNRVLANAGEVATVDWAGMSLISATAGVVTANWASCQLDDTAGVNSLDWTSRFLKNSSNVETLDWQGKTLIGDWNILGALGIGNGSTMSISTQGDISSSPSNPSTPVVWLTVTAGPPGSTQTYYIGLCQ